MQRFGQAADIVVRLDAGGFLGLGAGRFDDIRIDGALRQPPGARQLFRLGLKHFDKLGADDIKVMQENFIKASGGALTPANIREGGGAKAPGASIGRLAVLREKHPNAYRPWSDEQDTQLKELFEGGTTQAAISKTLGRQKGSIRSRLLKLGLIEEA